MGILKDSFSYNDFTTYLDKNAIRHKKIPLYSAWVGSFWERIIRTIKACIYKTVGRKHLEYFHFLSLISDIQNCINSRPLTYKDNDVNFEPLTPNSFLKLDTGTNFLLDNISGSDLEFSTRKDLVKAVEKREDMYKTFKDSWYDEYLLFLRETSREIYQDGWENKINVGDVVLIATPNKSRPWWSMGRVTELLHGKDGAIRTVKVSRPDGTSAVHSIKLLHPLELSVSQQFKESTQPQLNPEKGDENIRTRPPKRKAAIKCLQRWQDGN